MMVGTHNKQRILLSALLACLLVVLFAPMVYADLSVKEVKLPAEQNMRVEKVIFSENGAKMAVLLQETRSAAKRTQSILIYDLVWKNWTVVAVLADGSIWELEPLAFSANGSKLAFRKKSDIYVWDTLKNEATHCVEDVGSMTRAAFSYDNRYLALLVGAEWEEPASLCLFDLQNADVKKALSICVKYTNDRKAAGPLRWSKDGKSIYFIEEFTWGTLNSVGVLKRYGTDTKKAEILYNTGTATARVANYYFSPDSQYVALVLRYLDSSLQHSNYGLIIQKQGKFVYGTTLKDWDDPVENATSNRLSTAGWIDNSKFYWVMYGENDSHVYTYDVLTKQVLENNFAEQVYVSPSGAIIKLER